MADILIRNLAATTVARLKRGARAHKRSLQAHLTLLLEDAATFTMPEAAAVTKTWHRRLKGRPFANSATLVRRDRTR